MNKQAALAGCLLVAALTAMGCAHSADNKSDSAGRTESQTQSVSSVQEESVAVAPAEEKPTDLKLAALLTAYPDCIKGFKNGKLQMSDGTEIVFDDGKKKSFVEMLDYGDPEDQFFVAYDSKALPPAYQADAGRSRCDAMFKSMYGKSAAQVRTKMETVNWFGQKLQFSKVNGASAALRAVAADLAKEKDLAPYLKSAGTFYWRAVRGAKRMSAHSYGIAIDVGVPKSDYWLWKNPSAGENGKIKYVNRMPRKLVEIFERHGFIWGGAWYHYDTMHFEYRPEILEYAKLVRNQK